MVVTDQERKDLRYVWTDLLADNLDCVAQTASQEELLRNLARRTWKYGHYYLDCPARILFRAVPNSIHRPLRWKPRHFQRVRSQLVDAHLLFFEGNRYVLNLVGILKRLMDLHGIYFDRTIMERAAQVVGRAEKRFCELCLPDKEVILSDNGLSIEEALKAGFKQSEEGMDRRVKKKAKSYIDVRAKLIALCEKYDLKYLESEWTQKQHIAVKRWLDSYVDTGIDPRDILDAVVKNWRQLRKGTLTTEKGRPLLLPTTVSFWDFYVHRQRIEPWIKSRSEGADEEAEEYVPKYGKKKHGKVIQL